MKKTLLALILAGSALVSGACKHNKEGILLEEPVIATCLPGYITADIKRELKENTSAGWKELYDSIPSPKPYPRIAVYSKEEEDYWQNFTKLPRKEQMKITNDLKKLSYINSDDDIMKRVIFNRYLSRGYGPNPSDKNLITVTPKIDRREMVTDVPVPSHWENYQKDK